MASLSNAEYHIAAKGESWKFRLMNSSTTSSDKLCSDPEFMFHVLLQIFFVVQAVIPALFPIGGGVGDVLLRRASNRLGKRESGASHSRVAICRAPAGLGWRSRRFWWNRSHGNSDTPA